MSMGKRAATGAVVLWAAVLLSGCAVGPQKVVADDRVWKDSTAVIGVAVAKLPQGAAYKAGAQGLLDIAINNAMASGLEGHLAKNDYSQFNALADQIAATLQERGLTVKRLAEPVDPAAFAKLKSKSDASGASSRAAPGKGRTKPKAEPEQPADPAAEAGPNKAERDYRSLAAANGIDKLLIVNLTQAGTMRPYYGFIPMGPPTGYAAATGQLIDLKTNELQWNASAASNQPVVGEWDAPPDYVAVDKASAQAVDVVMKALTVDLVALAPAGKPATATAAPATAASGGK